MKNFKQGDWVFYEFSLHMIKEIDGGKVKTVTNGRFQRMGGDLTSDCYPLTIEVKELSDSFAYYSKEFHSQGNAGTNYPDLQRELVRRWQEACDNIEDEEKVKELMVDADKFFHDVLSKMRDMQMTEVHGIRLIRR